MKQNSTTFYRLIYKDGFGVREKSNTLSPADVEKFKSFRTNLPTQHETTRKPATILRELSIISKVFSLAIKNDFLDFNPCSRVEKPKFDNVQNRVLSYKTNLYSLPLLNRIGRVIFADWH